MANNLNKKYYLISATAATFAVSRLVKMLIKKGYKNHTGKQPPENPEAKNASLKEVLLFSFATALVGATAKIIARKYLAKAWQSQGGELPAHLD